MRRYISLACVALVVIMCMVSPVSAAESNSGSLINVLDYASANYSGENIVYSTSSSLTASASYTIPFYPVYRYVDLLINTISGNLTSCSMNGTNLQLEQVQSRLWRVYGSVPTSANDLVLTFTGDSYNTGFNIVSFNISTYPSLSYDIEAYCDIGAMDFTGSNIHYVPTDEINYRQFLGTEDIEFSYLNLNLYTNDWKKYDYIDFQINLTCMSVNSISAVLGSTIVPLEVCITENSSFVINDYYITIRMDVSGLDRTIDDVPMIIIDGVVAGGMVNLVHVVNVSGNVSIDNIDSNSYWLYRLYLSTLNGFSSIYSYFESLNVWISNHTTSVLSGFSILKDSIYVHFTNLDSWISSQTVSIQAEFSGLRDSIFVHFTNLNNWISNQTSLLEAAIRGDTAPGDSFQQEVDQKDQQLNDMAAVMDSVNKPQIDSVNVSADSYVDQTVLATSMSGLTAVISMPVFLDVIMMALIMATAGYVLFGKR